VNFDGDHIAGLNHLVQAGGLEHGEHFGYQARLRRTLQKAYRFSSAKGLPIPWVLQ
jgi:hypothetical protein